MHIFLAVTLVYLLRLSASASASDAQFYDTSSNVGFALSTAQNGTSTDLFFQISAPVGAGWGAVGIGDKMDGSVMFIMYPSTHNDSVTVSVRTAHGHDTPEPITDIDLTVQSSSIQNSMMNANCICRNCTGRSGSSPLDTSSTEQPWIWASGPGKAVSSDSQDADIDQHARNGVFFMDMTATQTDSAAIPSISGNSDIKSKALPGSVSSLVIVHAICLAGSFLLLFPLGVIALRWFGSFKLHWTLQILATSICIIGLVVAIALSVMDPEYASFNQAHQIIGIIAVAALIVQALLGYSHHRNYKKYEQRTWVSYCHLWVGRVVIGLGMFNAVPGLLLAGSTGGAVGIAILALIIYTGTLLVVYFGNKRRRSSLGGDPSASPNIALRSYNRVRGEGNGYNCESADDQSRGSSTTRVAR